MVDKNKIKNTLECDDKFLNDLFEKFISETSHSMELLNNALASKNWSVVKGASHKMLSSTRIFEMHNLSEILMKIELLSNSEMDLDEIPKLVEELNLNIKEVYKELK